MLKILILLCALSTPALSQVVSVGDTFSVAKSKFPAEVVAKSPLLPQDQATSVCMYESKLYGVEGLYTFDVDTSGIIKKVYFMARYNPKDVTDAFIKEIELRNKAGARQIQPQGITDWIFPKKQARLKVYLNQGIKYTEILSPPGAGVSSTPTPAPAPAAAPTPAPAQTQAPGK